MKKTKRYDDGGYTGDDPIVKYRMGMIDDKGNDITKPASRDFDESSASSIDLPAAKSVERTVVKTKVSPSRDFDTTDKSVATPKKSAVKELKDVISAPSMPKSFKESGGNMSPKKSSSNMPSMRISLPDPLSGFDSKGKRVQNRDFDYKKGGKVSSASKRADGIAMKGKTRGRMV